MVRLTNKLLLESHGHEVFTAETAEQALEELTAIEPAILLVDVSLPGMSGLELLRLLPKPLPPTVVLSGHDAEQYRTEAFAAGASAFISKHEGPRALLEAVKRLLEDSPVPPS